MLCQRYMLLELQSYKVATTERLILFSEYWEIDLVKKTITGLSVAYCNKKIFDKIW